MRASVSFPRHFSSGALANIFVSEIGIDSAVGIDRITGTKFKENLAEEIQIIAFKVNQGTYKFTNYRQLLIPKGPQELPRELCIPTVRDKVALKALSMVLDDVYGEKCRTPQPQPIIRSISCNMQNQQFDCFVKFDIKHFFASVNHEKLFRILRRKIRKEEILSLIRKAITTPSVSLGGKTQKRRTVGLPEGLSISNRLANLYLQDIDSMFMSEKNIEYHRYVDDIIILCQKEDIPRIKLSMNAAIKALSLDLHSEVNDKSQSGLFVKDPFTYLGYVFSDKGIEPKKQSRMKLERWIESHMRAWRNARNRDYWEWKLRMRITGCRITEDGVSYCRYGWLYYFSQSTNAAFPHKLDALLKKLAARYEADLHIVYLRN